MTAFRYTFFSTPRQRLFRGHIAQPPQPPPPSAPSAPSAPPPLLPSPQQASPTIIAPDVNNTDDTSPSSSSFSVRRKPALHLPRNDRDALGMTSKKIVAIGFVILARDYAFHRHPQVNSTTTTTTTTTTGNDNNNRFYPFKSLIDSIIGAKVFTASAATAAANDSDNNKKKASFSINPDDIFPIECFNDVEHGLIYLMLAPQCATNSSSSPPPPPPSPPSAPPSSSSFSQHEDDAALGWYKSLLFLCHVCHILVFIDSGSSMGSNHLTFEDDIAEFSSKLYDDFVHQFKVLQLAKQIVNPQLLQHLDRSSFTLEPFKRTTSLYFPGKVLPVIAVLKPIFNPTSKETMAKVEASLETTIRNNIRRNRFAATDNPRTPLFMVEPHRTLFLVPRVPSSSLTPPLPEPSEQFGFFTDLLERSEADLNTVVWDFAAFDEFLTRQIYFSRRQVSTGKKYQLPTCFTWFHMAWAFEEFLYLEEHNVSTQTVTSGADSSGTFENALRRLLNPDIHFSELRSNPLAFSRESVLLYGGLRNSVH